MKKIIYGAEGGERKAHSRVNREGKNLNDRETAAASFELFPFEFMERSLIFRKKN